MYHLNISWWRKRRSTEVAGGYVPDHGTPSPATETDDRVAIRAALQQLTAKQRAVLVLRYFEDASVGEAAELLGVTVGTVKSQSAKALAKLRTPAPQLLDSEGVLK